MDFLRQLVLILLSALSPIGAAAILFVPRRAARWTAFGVSAATFVSALLLLLLFDPHTPPHYAFASDGGVVQFVRGFDWLKSQRIQYLIGVDGLSAPLLPIISLICFMTCLASWKIEQQTRSFFALLLLFEAAVITTLISLNLLFFDLFFIIALIILCLFIGAWSGPRSRHALARFVLFSSIAILLLLIALIQIHHDSAALFTGGTFDLIQLAHLGLSKSPSHAPLLILLSMAILLPIAPLHSWLPEILSHSPAPIRMLISATVPTLAGYVILRLALPLYLPAIHDLALPLAILGLLSTFYGVFTGLAQTDLRKILAFSILSHMGLFLLAMALLNSASLSGALLLLAASATTSAAISFISGIIEDRAGHTDITRLGGIADLLPRLWGAGAIAFLCDFGLPTLASFAAILLIILGAFTARPTGGSVSHILAILAALSMPLTAAYSLRVLNRIFFGPSTPQQSDWLDLRDRDIAILAPLSIFMFLLGLLPWLLFLSFSSPTLSSILQLPQP